MVDRPVVCAHTSARRKCCKLPSHLTNLGVKMRLIRSKRKSTRHTHRKALIHFVFHSFPPNQQLSDVRCKKKKNKQRHITFISSNSQRLAAIGLQSSGSFNAG